ncbi:hypothetical protein NL676_034477 [Syzygium grande]|nr:hypothetical protein NL676_034477 [Syzygium grande]
MEFLVLPQHHMQLQIKLWIKIWCHSCVAAPGTATFYEPLISVRTSLCIDASDCPGVKEPGPTVATASDSIWNDGPLCGKKFKVTCLGRLSTGEKFPCKGSVIMTVVDRRPVPRCENTLELSRPAVDKIVDPTLVKIIIDYKA